MSRVTEIVDRLLESEDSDLEDFAREAGVLSPGRQVADAFAVAKLEKERHLAEPGHYTNRGSKDWFFSPNIRFGNGHYHVNANVKTGRTLCRCEVRLPDTVTSAFNILNDFGRPVHIRNTVLTDQTEEAVRAGIDKLYQWATRQLQKWDDLAFVRRTFRRIEKHDLGGSVNLEFRQRFKVKAMAGWETTGYAASPVTSAQAARMRAWLQARLPQLGITEAEEGAMTEVDFEAFARDAGVLVTLNDFVTNGTPDRFGRWSTGNYSWSISYKHLLYKGKPVYIGRVNGAHDYNNTGHGGIVSYWAEPPVTVKDHFPINKRTGERYKRAKQRTYRGYGAVRFLPRESGGGHFTNLLDACKYLLSLLKIQYPLRPAGNP